MRSYTAVIEKCMDTGLYVGYVPGFPGAHSQGETFEELNENLKEVVALLLEAGEPRLETEFVGTQNVVIA
jgi:predicted RNase H-like HicB family nuclease